MGMERGITKVGGFAGLYNDPSQFSTNGVLMAMN